MVIRSSLPWPVTSEVMESPTMRVWPTMRMVWETVSSNIKIVFCPSLLSNILSKLFSLVSCYVPVLLFYHPHANSNYLWKACKLEINVSKIAPIQSFCWNLFHWRMFLSLFVKNRPKSYQQKASFVPFPFVYILFCLFVKSGGMEEDGSFIGKYSPNRNAEQSSAFATLV